MTSSNPDPETRITASERLGSEDMSADIYNALKEHELELNRATAAFEHAALRPGAILNGGAATAFVTLLGSIGKKDGAEQIDFLLGGIAIGIWTVGLILAALAIGYGWHSQRSYTRNMKGQRAAFEFLLGGNPAEAARMDKYAIDSAAEGRRSQGRAIWLAALTYVTFVLGIMAAVSSVFLS